MGLPLGRMRGDRRRTLRKALKLSFAEIGAEVYQVRRDVLGYCSAACAFIPGSKTHLSRPSLCISSGFSHLRLKSVNGLFLPPDPSCLLLSCFNFPTRFIPATFAPITDDPGSGIVTRGFALLSLLHKRNGQKGAGRGEQILQPLKKKNPIFLQIPHVPPSPNICFSILFLVMEEQQKLLPSGNLGLKSAF